MTILSRHFKTYCADEWSNAIFQISVWFLCWLILTSCAGIAVRTVSKKIDLEYVTPSAPLYADSAFSGLRAFIRQSTTPVNIVLTHGLAEAESSHFDFMVAKIAFNLGLVLQKKRPVDHLDLEPTNVPQKEMLGFDSPNVLCWEFLDSSGKRVNFYFIHWSPITAPAKQFIRDYHHTRYRTGLSRFAKEQYLIDVFGDLALYLNTAYQIRLHQVFLRSIEKIDGEIVVIGGGFGIQIMFDALLWELQRRQGKTKLIASSKEDSTSLAQTNRAINVKQYTEQQSDATFRNPYNIRKIFLTSNQLPFTSLLNVLPDDTASVKVLNSKVYSAVLSFCAEQRKRDKDFGVELISFYDPNDPLGYRLPPTAKPYVAINNISVNTVGYWQFDPKKVTDLVLPKLRDEKAAESFLGFVDQQKSRQHLLFNLKGPATASRNDYRIIGALVEGSDYKLVEYDKVLTSSVSREMVKYPRKFAASFLRGVERKTSKKLGNQLQIQGSILPFPMPSDFIDERHRAVPFMGLENSISENSLTQLLTVHGVKDQIPDHFDELTGMVAEMLRFYGRPVTSYVICDDGKRCENTGHLETSHRSGTVKVTEYGGVYGKRLIIYNVYLSSITKPVKQWLDSTSIYAESSITSRLVKQVMITDGFSDIEMNFQGFKKKSQDVIGSAFRLMQKDRAASGMVQSFNTYYLTGSLGSRILLDFIEDHKNDPDVKDVQRHARTWFMLTNQIVMTELKEAKLNDVEVNDSDNAISYRDFYKGSAGWINDAVSDSNSIFDVVAFNDPNDILSFTLPDSIMGLDDRQWRIHNNYLNLAEGININMDAVIRYVSVADRVLRKRFLKAYRAQLDILKTADTLANDGLSRTVTSKDKEFKDYEDILKIAEKRIRIVKHYSSEKAQKNDRKIEMMLSRDSLHRGQLRECLELKRSKYNPNIYVSRDSVLREMDKYKKIVEANPDTSKFLLKKKNVKRLYKSGLIMPLVRNVSSYDHYQDFVLDVGRAHVGSKSSKKVATLISRGFAAVPRSNINQHLYNPVHRVKR